MCVHADLNGVSYSSVSVETDVGGIPLALHSILSFMTGFYPIPLPF